MDYARYFSGDVPSFLRSPVREIFRKVDLASIYSFAGGYPDASTFPLAEMEGLTRRVVEKHGARALQYGGTQGVTELREIISQRYDVPLERVQITTSSQQGIDVCARVFLNPGDVVLTTYPAYLGALQSFRAYRAAVHRLPLEDLSTPGQGQGEGPIADGRGRSERSERSSDKGCSPAVWTVKLKMIDVEGVSEVLGGYFLNTGTRHFVKFVEDVDAIDVATEGKALRWNKAFAPEGANINFVQQLPDGSLKIRTFEKGVEGETLACGTGITASALAAYSCGEKADTSIRLQARRGDILTVDFIPEGPAKFHDIHLTGPAEFV